MGTSISDTGEPMARLLRPVLSEEFGIDAGRITRIHAGTASDNFAVAAADGARWFVKVYRSAGDVNAAVAAIELTEFAGAGGTPVPAVRRSRRGDVVAERAGLALSVWALIDGDTAEGGLRGERWRTLGAATGRLHRHLATHPRACPTVAPPLQLLDLEAATAGYDRLIQEYRDSDATDGAFRQWALDALTQRRALLPTVLRLLQRLPPSTRQVLHGDLAAPNVMLRGDEVAAVIDFQPPTVGFLAWEVARIACDPRTLAVNGRWREELPTFLDAYRAAHPAVPPDDLSSVLAVGAAYTLASSYPLSALLRRPGDGDESLRAYGRSRHLAGLAMLEAASADAGLA